MKEADVRARAYAMPLTNPAYPPGPYRFNDREFLIITYRTDSEKLRLPRVSARMPTSCLP
jgi:acetoacetate decarboxylase